MKTYILKNKETGNFLSLKFENLQDAIKWANFADIPDGFGGCHTPTTAERELLTARIAERIMASRKQTWHYNRQPITKQQAVELLTNN